jgi:hypothetical protein
LSKEIHLQEEYNQFWLALDKPVSDEEVALKLAERVIGKFGLPVIIHHSDE